MSKSKRQNDSSLDLISEITGQLNRTFSRDRGDEGILSDSDTRDYKNAKFFNNSGMNSYANKKTAKDIVDPGLASGINDDYSEGGLTSLSRTLNSQVDYSNRLLSKIQVEFSF